MVKLQDFDKEVQTAKQSRLLKRSAHERETRQCQEEGFLRVSTHVIDLWLMGQSTPPDGGCVCVILVLKV